MKSMRFKRIICWCFVLMMLLGLAPINQAQAASNEFAWFWPVGEGKSYSAMNSSYGYREYWNDGEKIKGYHYGIDITGSSAIYAAEAGTVTAANTGTHSKTSNNGRGTYVQIDHGDVMGDGARYVTLYCHLSSMSVKKGDTVVRGQKIGVMGHTGNATGTHLHFVIRKGSSSINNTPKYFNDVELKKADLRNLYSTSGWEVRYTNVLCKHESRNNLGVCTNCGHVFDWKSTKQVIKGTVVSNGLFKKVDIRDKPYGAATKIGELSSLLSLASKKVVARYNNHYKDNEGRPHVWYECLDGGYIYSGDVLFHPDPGRVVVDVTLPKENFEQGKAQAAKGQISSTVHDLERAKFGIYNANGTPTQYLIDRTGINAMQYVMTSNDDKEMAFSKLRPGQYSYIVQGWDVYSASATARQDFWVNAKALPVYLISFDANGGSRAPAQMRITAGNSVNLNGIATVPTRYNYNFLGWSTDANATSATYGPTSSFTPNGSMTLYAVWQAILPPVAPVVSATNIHVGMGKAVPISWQAVDTATSYTATAFDANEDIYTSATVSAAQMQALLLFKDAGEYTVRVKASNTAGESAYSEKYSTVTVYEPASVTFVDYNDTVLSVQKVAFNDSAIMPESPERAGYKFIGWDGSLDNVIADRTLKAEYRAIPYTVKFLDVNGIVAKTETVYYDGDTPGSATPPDASALNLPSGYVLAGWDTNEYQHVTRTGIIVKPSVIWGNQDVPISTTINTVSKAGDGYWVDYTIANHGNLACSGRVVVVLKSNFGKFLTKTESGAFYLLGGDTQSYHGNLYVPLSETIQNEIFTTVEAYVVSNYTSLVPIAEPATYSMVSGDGDWSQWMTAAELANFKGSYTESQTKVQKRSKTKQVYETGASSYLDWTLERSFTVKSDWSNWSGWSDSSVTANENREVQTQQAIASAAYNQYRYGRYRSTNCSKGSWAHFNDKSAKSMYGGDWYPNYTSWSTTRQGIVSSYYGITTKNNSLGNGIWYNSRYRWHKYTVGGVNYYWEEVNTIPATYKTQYSYRTRYDIQKYVFYKWSEWSEWSDADVTAADTRQVEERTLTRVKLPEPPTDGLRTIEGSVGNLPDIEGKQAILTVYKVDEASDYSNEYIGQTVLGENGSYSFSFRTLEEPSIKSGDFTATLTIEGASTPLYIATIPAPKPTYQVEFADWDGTRIGEVQTVEEGSSATSPEIPTREGYTFIGWEYGLSNIRDDMTINARYSPNKYTVVFADMVNGMLIMQTDITHGSQLTLPEVVAPEGYTFIGWKAPEGFSVDNVTGSMIVVAEYQQLQYTVRFLDSDGTVISEQQIGHGEAATPPAGEDVKTNEGEYFNEWSSDDYYDVEQPLDITPIVIYDLDAPLPEAGLAPGVYQGEQTLTFSCENPEAVITYSFAQAEDVTEGDSQDIPYDGPITLTESATIEVTCSLKGHNDSMDSFEYVIVPTDSVPTAPASVTATETDQKISVTWDAVDGVDGYVIYKTDLYGTKERFITSETTYLDENVIGITDYFYEVASYKLVGNTGREVFMESEDRAESAMLTFFGEYTSATDVTITSQNETMYLGESMQFTAVVTPEEAYDRTVTWTVTNGTGSAIISDNGVLTATSTGSVTVQATANDGGGATGSETINIIPLPTDKITLTVGSATLKTGKPATVSVSISENSNAAIIQFALLYDATKLTLSDYQTGAVMRSKQVTINTSMPGVVYFNWDSVNKLTDGGSLIDLTFTAESGLTPQDVTLVIPTTEDGGDYDFVFMKMDGDEPVDLDVVASDGKLTITTALLGDVNSDGRVNVIDCNMVRRYAARFITLNEQQLSNADVNGDGKVNVIDSNYIRRYIAKLITVFPAEQ